jgi:hypothetical protein
LSDGVERSMGSDPLSMDTDRDGLTDGFEQQVGTLGPAPDPAAALQPISAPIGGSMSGTGLDAPSFVAPDLH